MVARSSRLNENGHCGRRYHLARYGLGIHRTSRHTTRSPLVIRAVRVGAIGERCGGAAPYHLAIPLPSGLAARFFATAPSAILAWSSHACAIIKRISLSDGYASAASR